MPCLRTPELVGRALGAGPEVVVIDHNVTARGELRVEGLQGEQYGLVLVAVRMEKRDIADLAGHLREGVLEPPLDRSQPAWVGESPESLMDVLLGPMTLTLPSRARAAVFATGLGRPSKESNTHTSRLGAPTDMRTEDRPFQTPQSNNAPGTGRVP
jgi:hypothetical protein